MLGWGESEGVWWMVGLSGVGDVLNDVGGVM